MKSFEFWRCLTDGDVPKGIGKCPACGSKPRTVNFYQKEFSDKEAAEIQESVKMWQAGQDFHDGIHKAMGEENS